MLVTETADVPSLVVIAGAATKKNKLYKRDKCNSENIKKRNKMISNTVNNTITFCSSYLW